MTQEPGKIFDQNYYQTGCGRPYQRDEEWLKSFDAIAEQIVRDIAPKTVLDAGCALGFLVEGLRNHGAEAYGVDISDYAIQNTHESIRPFCWVGSIAEPFPQKYDLIVTIEVLEHMPKAEAEKAVANLCQHTDDILFSSGSQDFREVTHFNLQPAEYWAELFAQNGFFRDVDYDASFITHWAVRFRRMHEPVHRIVMGYERRIDRLIQENAAVRQVNVEQRNLLAHKERERDEIVRENGLLRGQIDSLTDEIASLRNTIEESYREIALLRAQIDGIVGGKTYRAVRSLRSLAPAGSRREKLGLKVWQTISTFRNKKKG